MAKALKRILITVAVLALLCGAIWGGLVLYRNAQQKPVNVYAVSDFAQTEYWGDSSESYGTVTTDGIQHVMISDTQQVREVYVAAGQSVRVGDALLAYDTTLSDLDLEKAEIDLQKLKLQLETAEADLVKLQNMRPHSTVLITPPSSGIQYVPQATPLLLQGSGTEEDPFYYLWGENDAFSLSMLAQFFPTGEEEPVRPSEPEGSEPTEPTEPAEPADPIDPMEPDIPEETEPTEPEEASLRPSSPGSPSIPDEPQAPAPVDTSRAYVVFLVRQNNALNAPIRSYWGLYLDRSSGEITFRFFDPILPPDIQDFEVEPEPYYESYGSDYTAAELAEMRADKEQEIIDLRLAIRMAEVELEALTQEVSDGVVRSKIDGVVREVRDADEAYQQSLPVVEVSGGGGFYIDVAMSEMEFGTLEVGQSVTVNSWQSGGSFEGTIVEISEYPAKNADSWSAGNTNVSYYPFRVFVDESAMLTEFEYVGVTYQSGETVSTGLYLSNEFIRTDGARSYVFVRGADGKLEERTVETGRSLWGSATEICSGLTLEDYIAFPYGRDTVSGAQTVESTMDAFYGY